MTDKKLSFYHVFSIASGAMISSGLFILPGVAHSMAGPGVIWSYFLAGVLAMTGALSISELTTAMPKTGGDYFFITRGFGPGIGTISGLLSWIFLSLKSAFAIVGMLAFMKLLIPNPGLGLGFVICLIFVLLNIFGVKEAANVQVVLVFFLLILLVMFILLGIPKISSELLIPFAPYGYEKIFFTTGFVFVSYGGLLKVSSIAEEIHNPGKIIPYSIIFSLILITILYMLTVTVASGVLNTNVLDNSLTPISDAGRAIMGDIGFIAMTICAMIAFITTANAGIMSASRYLVALSRDRLIPPVFSWHNKRLKTPYIAILTTAIITFLGLWLDLKILVEAASIVLVLMYMLACLSVILLRESKLQNYRPIFKSPLYPWLQIVGILGLGFILYEISLWTYLISIGFIFVGFLIYYFYGKPRVKQESALNFVIHRLSNKSRKGFSSQLEEELRNIVHKRDNIKQDSIYYFFEKADILDFKEKLSFFDLFEKIATRISKISRGNISPESIERHISCERLVLQNPSSALLFIDYPEGTESKLLAIRLQNGVEQQSSDKKINCFLVLYGKDLFREQVEKISGIVEIVTSREFTPRWLSAHDEQGLKDVLVLAQGSRKN